MSHRVAAALLLAVPTLTSASVVLYPGTSPVLPTAFGWQLVTQAPAPAPVPTPWAAFTTGSGHSVRVSSLADRGGYGGFIYTGVPLTVSLNTLEFRIGLVTSDVATGGAGSRAGLSVLLLDASAHGVELGFWPDRIFSQEVGFTAVGESVLFAPTNPTDTYTLALLPAGYELHVNGSLLLAGPLRDYSATTTIFGPVYSQPNFLFVGDNTTRAAAEFDLGRVRVIPEPAAMGLLPALAALSLRRSRPPALAT